MGLFYIVFGSVLFVADVVSLWPAARYFLGELHFYFFFVFGPVLLIAMAMVFVGLVLRKNARKKASQKEVKPTFQIGP